MWSVVLSSNAISLETRQYTSIAEYSDRFNALLEAATAALPITERLRLGFRFINEIRVPGAETLNQCRSTYAQSSSDSRRRTYSRMKDASATLCSRSRWSD